MATRSWNKERASRRIDTWVAGLPARDIEIKDYVRDTNLAGLPNHVAYRVNGVHLYADILNVAEMLDVTSYEGEVCHKRTLRFLNLHYRAVYRILQRSESIFVDFHNQRLHSVIAKPYDDAAARVRKAVAVAKLIIDVLAQTGDGADHPPAKVRVGIDTGIALAVNNGRRGHREPLFLGEPANYAAKRAGGGRATGIFLTNKARQAIGLSLVPVEDATALSLAEIQECQRKAYLGVTADQIVREWREDLNSLPIGTFEFSAHTPPFQTLDIEQLSARNSRRQDAGTLYADLDGFTAYVAQNVGTDSSAKNVVRVLHVLRSELDAVLHTDFYGRKVRFIGDCVHGLMVEGTAQTTDEEETVSNMTLCSAAMRSSFNLALLKLKAAGADASSLGLQIGFEFGPINVTRLGMKGELIRCSVSRAVLQAEAEQGRCRGNETAIGATAYLRGSQAIRELFGTTRKLAALDYDTAVDELSKKNDKAAKATRSMESSLLKPATAATGAFTFPPAANCTNKTGWFRMIWFFQDVARSKLERRELEELVGSVDWLVGVGWKFDSTRLAWDGDILVGERVYPITLRYPNHFPYSPPLVLPRGDNSWWSSHQYGAGGELCLEYGPDNWHPYITGAEMVRSAYRLLVGEDDILAGGPAIPSRHRSSVAEQIGGKRRRFFFDVDAQTLLNGLIDDRLIAATIVIEYGANASVRFLVSAKIGATDWKGNVPPAILDTSFEKTAALLRWPEEEDRPPADSAQQMRQVIIARGMDLGSADHVVLVHGSTVLAYQLHAEDDSVVEVNVILEDERRPRLSSDHETLAACKVAIIGCGSMGSKVASILARSGVGQFVLVDKDIFLPENLVRNDLDWRDVGVHKVDAVANRIALVNPAATLVRYRRDLGGQGSSGGIEGLIEVLEGCDLLIDATASPAAFEVLSAVRGFAKRSMVWGEVFAGGIGGFIARSRSGSEPNPMTMRRTIESWCAENGRLISPAPAPYEGGEEMPSIANDAEVSIIASHLAAFSIDTLIQRTPSAYLSSVYLIGLQAEWIFDQAFEVRPISVGPPDDDAPADIDSEAVYAEIIQLGKLLKEHPDADTPES